MNIGETLQSFKSFIVHSLLTLMSEINSSVSQSFYVRNFILFTFEFFKYGIYNTNISILANTGGLLCLFLGFSAVSMVEIFYFIALRSYCKRHENQSIVKTEKQILKSNYKSKVSTLTTKNQIWPYTRTHGRTHLDSYISSQTLHYRKKY